MMSRMGSSTLMMLGATKKSRCKVCGKVFYHTPYHAYHGCCTHKCMRENEKAQTPKSNWVFTPAKLNARIEKCKERIEHYTALADDSNITQKRRNVCMQSVRNWKQKLGEAQEALKLIEKKGEQESESV